MKNRLRTNSFCNNLLTNQKGETTMNCLTLQIGNVTIYSNDATYFTLRREELKQITFKQLPVGVEILVYDSIVDNHLTLEGKRISLKKEYETRVVIGCVEYPEYSVIEDEELENTSCEVFVDNFLSLLNSIYLPINSIAA